MFQLKHIRFCLKCPSSFLFQKGETVKRIREEVQSSGLKDLKHFFFTISAFTSMCSQPANCWFLCLVRSQVAGAFERVAVSITPK